MALNIEMLRPFGARVRGAQLNGGLDDATFARIAEAFNQHAVLVFPEQHCNDDDQTAFTARFGPLETRPPLRAMERNLSLRPEITDLSNVDESGRLVDTGDRRAINYAGNQMWHSDSSFKPVPAMASLLSARQIAPEGGDTEFADMRAAWDALPAARKRLLEGLVAVHDLIYSRRLIGYEFTAPERAAFPPVHQALVRTHPVSGRKSLYLGAHASHIVGWPEDEGRALLRELGEFATQRQFVYRHRWMPGDAVMWDNRCTLHRLLPWDVARYKRVMRRTTVAGLGPTVVDGHPIAVG